MMTAGERDRAPPFMGRKATCRLNAYRSFLMTDGKMPRVPRVGDGEALREEIDERPHLRRQMALMRDYTTMSKYVKVPFEPGNKF